MPLSFDFPFDTPSEFKPYIPHVLHQQKPGYIYGKTCLMPSTVFVTTRLVSDEELFFNYRYNPQNPYPDWFKQPDEKEAQRRWGILELDSNKS